MTLDGGADNVGIYSSQLGQHSLSGGGMDAVCYGHVAPSLPRVIEGDGFADAA